MRTARGDCRASTSVFTGLVMVCLYAPIIAVLVYSVDKGPT